jgi:hypothetical protein
LYKARTGQQGVSPLLLFLFLGSASASLAGGNTFSLLTEPTGAGVIRSWADTMPVSPWPGQKPGFYLQGTGDWLSLLKISGPESLDLSGSTDSLRAGYRYKSWASLGLFGQRDYEPLSFEYPGDTNVQFRGNSRMRFLAVEGEINLFGWLPDSLCQWYTGGRLPVLGVVNGRWAGYNPFSYSASQPELPAGGYQDFEPGPDRKVAPFSRQYTANRWPPPGSAGLAYSSFRVRFPFSHPLYFAYDLSFSSSSRAESSSLRLEWRDSTGPRVGAMPLHSGHNLSGIRQMFRASLPGVFSAGLAAGEQQDLGDLCPRDYNLQRGGRGSGWQWHLAGKKWLPVKLYYSEHRWDLHWSLRRLGAQAGKMTSAQTVQQAGLELGKDTRQGFFQFSAAKTRVRDSMGLARIDYSNLFSGVEIHIASLFSAPQSRWYFRYLDEYYDFHCSWERPWKYGLTTRLGLMYRDQLVRGAGAWKNYEVSIFYLNIPQLLDTTDLSLPGFRLGSLVPEISLVYSGKFGRWGLGLEYQASQWLPVRMASDAPAGGAPSGLGDRVEALRLNGNATFRGGTYQALSFKVSY